MAERFAVPPGVAASLPAAPIARPTPKKAPQTAPEPHGAGTRVVMQRVSATAKGILDQPFLFQVPPLDELPRQHEWQFTDYDTVGAGMQTRPGSRQLVQVTFDSLFVDDRTLPFVINKSADPNPVALVEQLVEIGNARSPFQLLVGQPDLWGVHYDVNMAATMRSLRVSEKHGERDARYFSIAFTEFRGISQAELTAGLRSDASRGGTGPLATLAVGSLPVGLRTLRQISKRYYGTTVMWGVIAKASGISVAGDVDLRAHFANWIPKPKIVVPPAQRKG